MKNKNILGTSHAKTILIGEHAVVYNKPAIALPLNTLTITVQITPNQPGQGLALLSDYYTGPLTQIPEKLTGIKLLIQTILAEHQVATPDLNLKIISKIPHERGMGSSAAVGIAIIRALYNYFNWDLTNNELLRLANISETYMHKSPSGLDATTCASDQPIWMIKNTEIKPLELNLDGYLVICDTGILGQTKEAIQIVKNNLTNNPQTAQAHLDNLEKLTYQAKEQLATNQVHALGQTFTQAQASLAALGVSLPEIDNLIAQSLTYGSLGSKITGGGRGGCLICLTADLPTAEKLATQMKQAGVQQTWIQNLQRSLD
ncbi:mevalonate kinase [Ligilactobacillus ceti]|uniref:Mevalonate kinase n=1 Tax=Ligilactobacillus ceti DSM 22408 TaxID=1122146 RepID=A0A0R2KGY6_9LACO|nr:mevalonate kinase [Ligilactobacillus ceti]KRN88659.1 mevalonate kinase [Ligilactobacillus ceti DSM 22408]